MPGASFETFQWNIASFGLLVKFSAPTHERPTLNLSEIPAVARGPVSTNISTGITHQPATPQSADSAR
jgi:hypothetical protein